MTISAIILVVIDFAPKFAIGFVNFPVHRDSNRRISNTLPGCSWFFLLYYQGLVRKNVVHRFGVTGFD